VRGYLLDKHLPDARVVTIYKGHDVSWYRKSERSVLSGLGIPADAFVVGFAANMRPVKGADVLIKSALHIPANLPVHFLMIGEVRDRKIEPLAAMREVKSRIHLTGYRADAAALSGACDVFVMPSLKREGLPRAVIEAMAQEIPVIVSRVGGMPELVDDGQTGLIVPPGNSVALAQAIMTLYEDATIRKDMGIRARKRIEAHFNVKTTIARYIALFRDTAEAS
jgi:glycosyltransferase involved in cell wall biosynthesis